MSYHRQIPSEYQILVDQVVLNMALLGLLPPTANAQCLILAEKTSSEFDKWLHQQVPA